MKMLEDDRTTYVDEDRVVRGLSYVAPNQARITCKSQDAGKRIMDAIEARFKVYQYVNDNGVEYGAHDLFFWCNDLYNTMGPDYSGSDLRYFTLNTNDRKPVDEQMSDFEELRAFISEWEDETGHAEFTYHSITDIKAVTAEAARVFAECKGKRVVYHGMIGWLRQDERNGYYFKKLRARKYGYRLSADSVCNIKLAA